jgi:hypothetical protein
LEAKFDFGIFGRNVQLIFRAERIEGAVNFNLLRSNTMEQQREEGNSPRSQFTKGLRNHRKRQATILAKSISAELAKIGLKSNATDRWATIGSDLDRWLRDPRLIEFRVMGDVLANINKAIAAKKKNRVLTLRIRVNHEDSKWTQDFVFCHTCEPITPELKFLADSKGPGSQEAKARMNRLGKTIERCQSARQRHGLVALHTYRLPEICECMSTQFFRSKGGVPFPRKCAVGSRLHENLKKVSGGFGRDPFATAGQTGDLFKVTYAANLTLHLRVAVVDANGQVVAEYGDETNFEVNSSEDDPAERRFARAVGELVSTIVGGSPPGEFLPAEG